MPNLEKLNNLRDSYIKDNESLSPIGLQKLQLLAMLRTLEILETPEVLEMLIRMKDK